jgi:very-short-patch-repair endonuclease
MPAKKTDNKTKHKAVQLRHEPTLAEVKLWRYLRADQLEGFSFRRQHAIGPFITDFCCIKAKLVIELDGGQHLEQEEYNMQRTAFLESQGYRVLRFWNNDVMKNIEGVVSKIQEALLKLREVHN